MSRSKRDTSQRRDKIARMLKENGSVQVLKLIDQFSVSGVTIRKDLQFLEEQGIATRSYGGAMLSKKAVFAVESPFERKQTLNAVEKSGISKAAAGLINDGDSIILDSGSTILQIAPHLKNKKGVTVVTNSHQVISELASFEHIEVISLGGTFRRKSQSFYGKSAEQALQKLHVDKLFLGVDGFNMERGITTHFEAEAELNRIMCSVASEVIVVTDSSKFGTICLHKILEPKQVNCIVTDSEIPQEYMDGLKRLGIENIVVST